LRATSSYRGLFSLLEESLFRLLLLRRLVLGEVVWPGNLFQHLLIYPFQVDLVTCRNDISGIDSSKRHTIDPERTCDEKGAFFEMFEEDDALPPETASEDDEN